MNRNDKKVRVYCLYRVSTQQQVDDRAEDIPLQREACHRYVNERKSEGWAIVREESEKGVSGFKVSAAKRTVLQEYLAAAKAGKFDVLLVFMYDRLGRIESETPFVLQEFVKAGVRCFSVNEGEQKFDDHVDKLLCYIRFWNSEGESIKLSMRLSEAYRQAIEAGVWPGGKPPFGYRLEYKGRVNKKNIPCKDIEIHPEYGAVLQQCFGWVVQEGLGGHVIANRLNQAGHRTDNGKLFDGNLIRRIIRNPIAVGYLHAGSGEETIYSPHIPALQIVSTEDYAMANKIFDQKSNKYKEACQYSRSAKSDTLLQNVYCGHCGHRMSSYRHKSKNKRADGSTYLYESLKYICWHKSQKKCACSGQHMYSAKVIDEKVVAVAKQLLGTIKTTPIEVGLQRQMDGQLQMAKQLEAELKKEVDTLRKKLSSLENEVTNSLIGDSHFTPELLSRQLNTVEQEIAQKEKQLAKTGQTIQDKSAFHKEQAHSYSKFLGWSTEFTQASNTRKRMILSELFEQVKIHRGNEVIIMLNPHYKHMLLAASTASKIELLNQELIA